MTDRLLSTLVELDLPRCQNIYGQAPCTAAGAAGTECYNTFGTCQDKPNYVQGVQVVTFTEIGAPMPIGVAARPYLTQVQTAPTEIDPEAGLARRALVTLSLRDETDLDVEFDPYIATRTTPAAGTFWGRFKARQRNYVNRPARIKRAYVTGGVWGATSTELYLIDGLKGPSGGVVTLALRDPLVLATKTKVPAPSSGKLAVELLTGDLQLTLASGEGAQYSASGWVKRGDEIIRYASIVGDVLILADGTYRAQFGTAAAPGKVGDGVQQCQVYIGQPFWAVVRDLLNRSGVVDANIDITGLQYEDNNWLGAKYRITACIPDPEDASAMIAELCKQAGGVMWWSPVEQKAKFKVIGPRSPMDTSNQLFTDAANIIDGSVQVERLDNLRLTLSAMYYDLLSATANRKESKNFLRADLTIDVDAESDKEYGSRVAEINYSRWFGAANANAMRALVQRRVTQYRDAPDKISFKLDPQDVAVAEGDLYDIETADLVDAAGNVARTRVLVLRRHDRGTHLDVVARTTTFNRRYGFIAPAGYPNYSAATEAQRAYAFISDSAGKMSDGTDGYLII